MNLQATKIQDLSKEVGEMFVEVGKAEDELKDGTKTEAELGEKKKAEFNKMQEFQAEAQVMNVLAQTVQNVVSTLGQSLSTASRKQ